jgi:hypothetical protein
MGKIYIGKELQKSLVKMGKLGVIGKYYFAIFEVKPPTPAILKTIRKLLSYNIIKVKSEQTGTQCKGELN